MKIKFIKLSLLMITSILLVGCFKTEVNENIKEEIEESIKIEKGSYLNNNNDVFQVYDIDNIKKYENIDAILTYNEESNRYVELKDEKISIKGKNLEIELEEQINKLLFSNSGEYLFYFKKNEYLEPKIFDIKNNKIINFESNVVISGELIDWISEEELLYYGINIDTGVNGMFTYNIKTSEEKEIYRLKLGYMEYLKNMKDKIVFIENDFLTKIIKEINPDGQVKVVNSVMSEVGDIININSKYYIMGRDNNELYSIYEVLDENNLKRLIYDFPIIIDIEEGLAVGKNKELLFLGSENSLKEKHLYKYENNVISKLTKNSGEYEFIHIN